MVISDWCGWDVGKWRALLQAGDAGDGFEERGQRCCDGCGRRGLLRNAGQDSGCEASGRVIEILNAPEAGPDAEELTAVAFAGTGSTWLYAVEAGKLYRRQVKVTYAPVWAPVKPPKPLL